MNLQAFICGRLHNIRSTSFHYRLKWWFKAFIRDQLYNIRSTVAKRNYLRDRSEAKTVISRADWESSLSDPSAFYLRCFRYFHQQLPSELRAHRKYFALQRRGFGEDAFHVMWYLLCREFKPRQFLEIGVYRGQVLSLVSLLQKKEGIAGQVTGISPFLPVGDSLCRYREGVEYLDDTLKNFEHFSLPKPNLLKAFSTDRVALDLIASKQWDCIYIDGNHDYEVVNADWEACSHSIRPQGLIILDDSSLDTSFASPPFATKGLPGPSKVAQEIDRTRFKEILRVGHNRVFQKLAEH